MRTADHRRSQALNERLHELVPGGAHTYAKGDDQYPGGLAPVIERGLGAHVWDVDGNEYVEYGSGLRAVALGHAHPVVIAAAAEAMSRGTNFTRPARIEVEAAEALLALLPAADMVKFAKNGSDATTAAVKLARAVTGRDVVAMCGDQPFFSTDDWFIGATAMPAGVPVPWRPSTVTFRFNDLASLEACFAAHPDGIACVMLEAATSVEPAPGFLEGVRELCDRHGALLVFDEMITGFRWDQRGAQHVYGVRPDLSTFGKALGNGFAIAALCGRRELMDRGGIQGDRERVFLLSTTHGAETHALAAAMAVIRIYEDEGVVARLEDRGMRLRGLVEGVIARHGLADRVLLLGRPQNLVFATLDADGNRSQAFRTLFLQGLIDGGVLGPSFVVSAALTDEDIDRTAEAVDRLLPDYAAALDAGDAEPFLRGRPVKPVMRPYA
jgi:glutamate-1-semialdehyde 2,1-aminomutase